MFSYQSRRLLLPVAGAVVAVFLAMASPTALASPPGPTNPVNTHGLQVITSSPDVPPDLADAMGSATELATTNPDDFSYPSITSGAVELSAVSDSVQALQGSAAEVKGNKLKSMVKQHQKKAEDKAAVTPSERNGFGKVKLTSAKGKKTVTQMNNLNDAVFDLSLGPQFADAGVIGSGIDSSGRVILTVNKLTDNLAATLSSKFGTTDIAIEVDPTMASSLSSRNSDTAPYWGGAYINVPVGWCSTGFAWVSGGSPMMLTAGHCAPNGGSVYSASWSYMGSVPNGSRENWDPGVGTVALSGQSSAKGDFALITMSQSVGASIYTGGTTSSTSRVVGQMWASSPSNGDQYCTGGDRTGELCGWVVDRLAYDQSYGSEGVVKHIFRGKRGSGIDHGDSGGSVYTVRSDGKVAAKGLISGQGSSFLTAYMYFTDIWDAYYLLPGTLKVA